MANKVFNNERPASVRMETAFYGRMKSDATVPTPKFTQGIVKNQNIDYGNQYTQVISASNTTANGTRKSGLINR